MDTATLWIGIVMSIILFANKALILAERKSGWYVGAFGILLAIIYLFLQKFPIMACADVGILAIMLYGALPKQRISERVEWAIRIATMITFTYIAFLTFSGFMTAIESFGSFFMLFGTYALTHGRKPLGWSLFFFGHLCTAYMAHSRAGQTFFQDLQIASAIVAAIGFALTYKPRR